MQALQSKLTMWRHKVQMITVQIHNRQLKEQEEKLEEIRIFKKSINIETSESHILSQCVGNMLSNGPMLSIWGDI